MNKATAGVCVCYLPVLVELSDGVLHLFEQAQCFQLPELRLLHLLLQSRHVVLIGQTCASLDERTMFTILKNHQLAMPTAQ